MIVLELVGLEVFGHHGVEEQERLGGQVFLFDLELEVPDDAASDRIEDAVDYRLVAQRVSEVSEARRFDLIEALATAVADALLAEFALRRVRVRVRKPGVRPAGLTAAWSAATVERPAPS